VKRSGGDLWRHNVSSLPRLATLSVMLSVAAAGSARLLARQAPQVPPTASGPAQDAEPAFARIPLTAGRSHVLTTDFDVIRIAVTNPAVADALVVQPREILIDGKGPGTVSLILWGADRRVQYDVVVEPGVSALQQQIQRIFPGEDIRVSATDEALVLSGSASTNEMALRAGEIAQASSTKQKVINMLQRPGGPDTQQIMLEVRFAEVEHNALMELGASFLASRANFDARTSTEQFPAPVIDASKPDPIQVPDYLNVFFFLRRDGLLAVLKALRQRGLFQSLAEPNLVAYNGQEASFLAGGEFPVPLVQGNTGQVTVQFKEFGVRLTFRPTIAGEVIRLKVRPEVSTLDFANGLTLAGFRVPALKTRRVETDVELRDGQSFAIAGLLDNQAVEDRQAIPLLSSLPIVGHLFKGKSDSSRRTELLVLITPHLVRPLEPAEVPALPVDPRRFIKPGDGLGGALEGGGGLVDAPAPKKTPKGQRP
jgi:pilus assembly protein CpaC